MFDELHIRLEDEDELMFPLENDALNIGTKDYNELKNKPKINGVELISDISLDDIKAQPKGNYPNEFLTNNEIEKIFNGSIEKIIEDNKKYLSENGLLFLCQMIIKKLVFKDGEKVLSDNNYTDKEKEKLSKIEDAAQKNIIEEIKINGIKQLINNKEIDISMPTKTSDLTNDKGFITEYTETDPFFSASAAAKITFKDITNWNDKANTSDIPDVSNKEDTTNKVTSITGSNTNDQYPSAKAVYDLFISIVDGNEVSY